MPQQAGNGVEVCPHFDMLLGVEMAAGMGRNADALYSLSVALYNVFNCTIGQLLAVIGKKVVTPVFFKAK